MISNTYSHGQKDETLIIELQLLPFHFLAITVSFGFVGVLIQQVWEKSFGAKTHGDPYSKPRNFVRVMALRWHSIIKHSTSNHTRKCTMLSSNSARKGKLSTFMRTSVLITFTIM